MTSTGPEEGAPPEGWLQGADLRTDRPTAARMYDYYLGGKDNFAVDRQAADQVVELLGEEAARQGPLENRAFLRRAVSFLARHGVDQFIDLGAGLPTEANVHEIAQQARPGARVVYVDNDPIVLAHARALLADSRDVEVITADLRRPDQVLDSPVTRRMIDFSRPVALLLFAVLQFVLDDDDPAGLVARYQDALPDGSWMALSHVTMDGFPADVVERVTGIYRGSASPATTRSHAEITALLGRMEPVEPGLVRAWQWRPEPDDVCRTNWFYGAVGQLRPRSPRDLGL